MALASTAATAKVMITAITAAATQGGVRNTSAQQSREGATVQDAHWSEASDGEDSAVAAASVTDCRSGVSDSTSACLTKG